MTWCSSILSISSIFSISDFGHARLFSKLFLSTTILLSLRCDSSLFSSVFFALSPISSLRCRLGCSLWLLASCRKHFAHFSISDEILGPHRVCNLYMCEEFFVGEIFLPSSKERVYLQSGLSWCVVFKLLQYVFDSTKCLVVDCLSMRAFKQWTNIHRKWRIRFSRKANVFPEK